MLSDEKGQVRKGYGVTTALGILPGRVTDVIDREGTVRHVFNSMTGIDRHVTEALQVVRDIQSQRPA